MVVKRSHIIFSISVLLACLLLSCGQSDKNKFDKQTLQIIPDSIRYHRIYDGHLQGMATDFKNFLFWSHTTQLVKTDLKGTVLKVVDVPTHHGDLAYYKGKLYVAVNLGKFNEEPGQADSWVYVYQPEDLKLLQKYPVPELVHGAGGMEIHKNRVMIVGGLPGNGNYETNFVYEYNLNFKFQKRHELTSGYTYKGIQTACFFNDYWYFACYGSEERNLYPVVLKAREGKVGLEFIEKYDVDMSHGMIGMENNEFLYSSKSLDKMAAKIRLVDAAH